MKQNRTYRQILLASVITLSVLACVGGSLGATATPLPTNTPDATSTPMPTDTATPKPTFTRWPTATDLPPTPTPAPIGVSVVYDSLEITVLDIVTHGHIVTGGAYYYYSKPGEIFIDLAVRVRNLNPGHAVRIQWSYIYIVEERGTWYPLYGALRRVTDGTDYDPFNIALGTEIQGESFVEFDDDTFLRLIYYVADDPEQSLFFGIENSPLMSFQLKE
ncbi:MAG TPA: hypothetical protein VJ821_00260 [Anaerolineales bacterium]|nr:hypothetical protein [Anaerolineales bacterium]